MLRFNKPSGPSSQRLLPYPVPNRPCHRHTIINSSSQEKREPQKLSAETPATAISPLKPSHRRLPPPPSAPAYGRRRSPPDWFPCQLCHRFTPLPRWRAPLALPRPTIHEPLRGLVLRLLGLCHLRYAVC
jgi:hypothetical protein